ncbi:cupredoxin domain-containing protein [Komagataeibacter kakiaceti]|uniref:hypothetical protein n=1 Tax=Komagataeibacter kakiaceti TaxID=943261 RepID=UPI000B2FA00D|nr:hypothetical protein [Komagataeibacter kakiaceti]
MIFFALFVWAARLYVVGFQPPAGAIQIYVTGKQWMWKVQYPGGQREINALHVPLGRAVQLLLTSEDVIHDFSIPVLRIKHDVLPGRYQSLWFIATRPGSFRFYCTQFCGIGHSRMTGTLEVLNSTDYADWLDHTPASGSLATQGEALFIHNGCSGCHASGRYPPDAQDTARAPSMVGLYGAWCPAPMDGPCGWTGLSCMMPSFMPERRARLREPTPLKCRRSVVCWGRMNWRRWSPISRHYPPPRRRAWGPGP